MSSSGSLRIGIFYDGQYFFKVSNYYSFHYTRKNRISIGGLYEFIRNKTSEIYDKEIQLCQIVDARYFRGRHLAKESEDSQLRGDRILMTFL